MFLNLQDYTYDAQGIDTRSAAFLKLLAILRYSPACRGRLHWGKAGTPPPPTMVVVLSSLSTAATYPAPIMERLARANC